MGNNSDFNIQIQIGLQDEGRQLVQQWEKLKKQISDDKIKVNLDFGDNINSSIKQITQMSNEVNNLQKQIEVLSNSNNKKINIINNQDFLNQVNEINKTSKTITELKQQLSSLGELKIKSNILDEEGKMKSFVAVIKQVNGQMMELQYTLARSTEDGQPSKFRLDYYKSFTDNTNKVLNDLEKFKTKSQEVLNSINNTGFTDNNAFKNIQEQINNLDINNFKEKTGQINTSLKELQTQAKNAEQSFNNIAKFSSEQQSKINTMFSNDILPKDKIINVEAKINTLNGNESQDYIKLLETEINNLIQEEKILIQQNKEYESSVKQTFKEQGDVLNYVIQQEERLKNIRASYNTKLDTKSNGYQQLQAEYNLLIQKLEQYRQEGKTLSVEESTQLKSEINDLVRKKNEIIEITNIIKQQENALQSLQNKFSNIITENQQLSNIVIKLKNDIQGLSASTNFKGDTTNIESQLNKLKELAAEKQRIQGLGANIGSGLNLNSSTQEIEKYIKNLENAKVQINQFGDVVEQNGNKIRTIHYSIDEGGHKFQQYKLTIDETTGSVYKFSNGIVDVSSKHMTFTQQIASAFESFTGFSLVMGSMYAAIHQVEEGIKSVIDMESDLATINTTMSVTKDQLKELGIAAEEQAMKFGLSVKEVVNAMKVYANMSETIDSIIKKSESDIVLSSLSGMNTTQTTDSINKRVA